MAVDPEKVKALRERTGLPMMDCKRALEKTSGDIEGAYEELRKAGHKAQEKLAGRTSNEGRIASFANADGTLGVLATLRCETEPVSKNEDFQAFLAEIVKVVAEKAPKDAAALKATATPKGVTVEAGLTELVNKIRENINLGRFARFQAEAIGQYVHFDQKKAAMVALAGGKSSDPKVAEVGRELCMHIVFSKPICLSRDKLDPAVVAKEGEILLEAAKNDPKNAKKPEEVLKKIVQGQVDKFVASKCLLEQPYMRDDKISIQEYLKNSGTKLTLVDFVYIATDMA
jgi:elongation factor Ts